MSSKMVFFYKGSNTEIQCNLGDTLLEICSKFCIKMGIDINNLYFLFKGNKLKFEKIELKS